jgi:hypothetical protein
MNYKEYRKYKLTYPFYGKKIYEASSKKTAVRKCYEEFKELDSIGTGIFSVMDLGTKKTYTYQIKKTNKIYEQDGGMRNKLDNMMNQLNNMRNKLNDTKNNI